MANDLIPDKDTKQGRTTPWAAIIMAVCLILVAATIELSKLPGFTFVAAHVDPLISAELAVCGITLVELVGRVVVRRFTERGIAATGHSLRAILRGGAYIALTVALVSVLASSPALAISIGTVSGVIIGFAAQNLIGNVFAGMMLAILRPVRIGDQINVGGPNGANGRVKEIDLIYTIVESDDNWFYVPSMTMFSTTVTRRKLPGEKAP